MHLLNFILNNKNWESILTTFPYNLNIVRDNNYIMFKYNQIASDFSLDIVKESRGIIFDERNWKVVCQPFNKFFNYNEPNASEINWSKDLKITEKIDGSLMKVWWHDNEWHLSTNGTIDAHKASCNPTKFTNFYDLFIECTHCNSLDDFAKNFSKECTHLFELVSPENRVVIPYKERKLYYLTSFYNDSGKEILFEDMPTEYPDKFIAHSLDDVLNAVGTFDWHREGYVVYDGENRIKVKGKAYVIAHYARNNNNVTTRHLIDVILSHEVDEFLTYAEDYKDDITGIMSSMCIFDINASQLKMNFSTYIKQGYSRKEYAQKVMELISNKFNDYLFKLYDNPTLTWDEYVSKWNASKWEKFLMT